MTVISFSVILGGMVLMTVGGFVFLLILLVVWFIAGKDVAQAWDQYVNDKLEALWFYNFLVEFSKAFNTIVDRLILKIQRSATLFAFGAGQTES